MDRKYLTLEEKIEELEERIYQVLMDEYDNNHSEDEIEQLLKDGRYFETVREQFLDIEGFEEVTFNQLRDMSDERIIEVYNIIYGSTITLQELEEMKAYWRNDVDVVFEENKNFKK